MHYIVLLVVQYYCQEYLGLIVSYRVGQPGWWVDWLKFLNYNGPKLVTLSTGQLAQLEERNAEVESQNSSVIQQNLELQRVERELRDNLLTFVSRSELQDVREKLRKSEQDRVRAPDVHRASNCAVPRTDVLLLEFATKENCCLECDAV
jgi:hypothetical protein